MKWLEIIRLRGAGIEEGLLEEFLQSYRTVNPDRSGNLTGIETYRHAALKNDLSVHLHWESKKLEQEGSVLGLRLAQALKEFGLIDHSIWIEEQR
jgi:hypothetical protein